MRLRGCRGLLARVFVYEPADEGAGVSDICKMLFTILHILQYLHKFTLEKVVEGMGNVSAQIHYAKDAEKSARGNRARTLRHRQEQLQHGSTSVRHPPGIGKVRMFLCQKMS